MSSAPPGSDQQRSVPSSPILLAPALSAMSTAPLAHAPVASYGSVEANPLRRLKDASASDDVGSGVDPIRARKRRDLMLDDDVLLYTSFEAREYITWRVWLYWIVAVLTGGTTAIIATWPFCIRRRHTLLSKSVKHNQAEFFIVENVDKSIEICPVERIAEHPAALLTYSERRKLAPVATAPKEERMTVYRHTRFMFSPEMGRYRQLNCDDYTASADMLSGLSVVEAQRRLTLFGGNVIDIPIPPAAVLILRECVHPFIMFQIWAVIVWMTENYYSFSAFIFAVAIASAVANFFELRKNLLQIRAISRFTTTMRVIRDGREMTLDSSKLVPGDVVLVDNDSKLPCDMVLLHGQCTVNEAMLTGESTVVTKQPVDATRVNDADGRNTLFGGSLVVQLRVPKEQNVVAVVVRTGFESVKGRLVLSILHPRAPHFKFLEQSLKFIALLFTAAMAGFAVNAKALSDFEAPIEKIVQRGCDMVTIVVPPALPLALTVGVAYALVALQKRKIFCISPQRVNLAGKINCFCFDKTGTLTTDSLELYCMRAAVDGVFSQNEATAPAQIGADFNALLACCHSLTHVKERIVGDPLEMQTFAFTHAQLSEPHTMTPQQAAAMPHGFISRVTLPSETHMTLFDAVIVTQFDFVPALQRMSVVVRGLSDDRYTCFVKGSPEMMKTLCLPETLPGNYDTVLREYTQRGYRVIAAGWKPHVRVDAPTPAALDAARVDAECNLRFLGFVVLENKLKDETAGVILRLRREADLSMHMITGDNMVSAVCVARKAGIVEAGYRVFMAELHTPVNVLGSTTQVRWVDVDDDASTLDEDTLMALQQPNKPYRLAMTGQAYMHMLDRVRDGALSTRALQRMLVNCVVYARASPENKASIVERLQEAGLYVGMIGDGANDSLALRAAHVGISLSQVEASVSAPFTSMIPDISCIPHVLCEGRGALATAFCMFQFMALYSTIQFANALLIVFSNSFLANNQYLYQDLFIVFILAVTLGNTPSATVLTKKRPSGQLLSAYNLTICVVFITLTFALQGASVIILQRKPWYGSDAYPTTMPDGTDAEGTNSRIPETTTVFLMSMLQYVAVATIFSIGYPWKQATYKNYIFTGWLLVVVGTSLFIFLRQDDAFYGWLSLQVLPQAWNTEMLAWSSLSFGTYFIAMGIMYFARRMGFYSWLRTSCWRTPLKAHKVARRQWAQQFRGNISTGSAADDAIKVTVSPINPRNAKTAKSWT